MTETKRFEHVAESGVVLTIFLSGLGYLLCYFYNYGYLLNYGVPATFINISLPSLVFSISITLIMGFSVFSYAVRYVAYEKQHKGKKRLIFYRMLWMTGLFFLVLYAFDLLRINVLLLISAATIFALGLLIGHKSIQSRSFLKGWHRFWLEWREGTDKEDHVANLLPARIKIYIVISTIAVSMAFLVGGLSARTQARYPSISSDGDTRTLVIQKSESEIVTKVYNVKSKTFEDGYTVRNILEALDIKTFHLNERNRQHH